ncbi:YcjF family protein [Desulfuromonas thiophila]|uniref:YcjF family protein n=1 Tax=Desulfuromonas thiophila TaxID=57664 RepID=UPI0029F5B013|nr:YcjF family protein [Desulfuromonas thiophila]
MNEKRTPGPVDAKASRINGLANMEENTTKKEMSKTEIRTPGKINASTEPVKDIEELDGDEGVAVLPELTESSPWKVFFILLVVTFFIWLLSEIAVSLVSAYREQVVWIWIPMTVAAAGLLATFAWGVRREYKAIRSVDAIADRGKKLQSMVAANNLIGLHQVLEPTLKNLRKRYPGIIREFEAAASERETSKDYIRQFDNIVLTALDKEAKKVIKNCVLTGSMAVAVSPHPALDSFFVLWRAKVLIRSVGETYGLQPTGFSAYRLMKHAVTSGMIAGAMEKSGEIVLTHTAENIALKAFEPVAEGATTAARLYRLGRLAQQICRPVPMGKVEY